MERDDAMKMLERVCGEKGVKLHKIQNWYKAPILYWPDAKSAIVYDNATDENIRCLIAFL